MTGNSGTFGLAKIINLYHAAELTPLQKSMR